MSKNVQNKSSKSKLTIVIIIVVILAALSIIVGINLSKPKSIEEMSSAELLDLGEKYLLDLNYAQAVVYFDRLIEIEPMNPRGYTGLAESYIALGDVDKAIELLQQGSELLPDDPAIKELLESLNASESIGNVSLEIKEIKPDGVDEYGADFMFEIPQLVGMADEALQERINETLEEKMYALGPSEWISYWNAASHEEKQNYGWYQYFNAEHAWLNGSILGIYVSFWEGSTGGVGRNYSYIIDLRDGHFYDAGDIIGDRNKSWEQMQEFLEREALLREQTSGRKLYLESLDMPEFYWFDDKNFYWGYQAESIARHLEEFSMPLSDLQGGINFNAFDGGLSKYENGGFEDYASLYEYDSQSQNDSVEQNQDSSAEIFSISDIEQITQGLYTVGDYVNLLNPKSYSWTYWGANGEITLLMALDNDEYVVVAISQNEGTIGGRDHYENYTGELPNNAKSLECKVCEISWTSTDFPIAPPRGVRVGASKSELLAAYKNVNASDDILYTEEAINPLFEGSWFSDYDNARSFIGGRLYSEDTTTIVEYVWCTPFSGEDEWRTYYILKYKLDSNNSIIEILYDRFTDPE